jgi:flagellin-specific chaperone FliS
MNAFRAYQQRNPGWTRADMLLALYQGAIERLDNASSALARGATDEVTPLLAKAQLIVLELAAGVDPSVAPAGSNVPRLCEFVLHSIRSGTPEAIASAVRILRILKDGFESIRDEANTLERSGAIPPAGQTALVLTLA